MKFKKKPVVIDAFLYTVDEAPDWFDKAVDEGKIKIYPDRCVINSLEGPMTSFNGEDYIIRGVDGEFYPCKVDIFNRTYEKVEQ